MSVTEFPVPGKISYSVKQAHEATGIGEWTLRDLVRRGILAARYQGTTILIDAESLHNHYRSLPSEQPRGRECPSNRGNR